MQIAHLAGIPSSVIESARKAGQVMKKVVGESFKSSEQREKFSTMHEEWLKYLLTIRVNEFDNGDDDDDTFDSLFCLWHELKTSFKN